MTTPPTRSEIDLVTRQLRIVKRVKERSGPHVIAACPFCGRKKLYVNEDSGLFDCKHGECEVNGNIWKLATQLGMRIRDKPTLKGFTHVLMTGAQHPEDQLLNAKGYDPGRVADSVEKLFTSDHPDIAKIREYIDGRGFTEETIRHFGLHASISGQRKEPVLGIPYFEADKVPLVKFRRILPDAKPKYLRTKGSQSPLFNADAIRNLRQVILVEGELDAISLWQLGFPGVASTSLGAKKDMPDEWKSLLENADDIILLYDDDNAGQTSAQRLATALGSYRCRIATWKDCPGNEVLCGMIHDANDLLQAIKSGSVDEDTAHDWCRATLKRAAPIQNTSVAHLKDFNDAIAAVFEAGKEGLGIRTSSFSFNRLLKGWRPGEITVVTGHTGHGKTTWINNEAHSLAQRGVPVLTSAFEGGPETVAQDVLHRELRCPLTSVKSALTREMAYDKLLSFQDIPLYVINEYGDVPLRSVIDAIRYAVKRHGVQFVVLDHLHYMLHREKGMDERQAIDKTSRVLTDLAVKLNVHIALVCHPKGSVGEDTIPSGGGLKGASSLKQNTFNGITVFRAKTLMGDKQTRNMSIKDDQGNRIQVELKRNQSIVYLWKARRREAQEGSVILDFDPRSISYTDPVSLFESEVESEDEFAETDFIF